VPPHRKIQSSPLSTNCENQVEEPNFTAPITENGAENVTVGISNSTNDDDDDLIEKMASCTIDR